MAGLPPLLTDRVRRSPKLSISSVFCATVSQIPPLSCGSGWSSWRVRLPRQFTVPYGIFPRPTWSRHLQITPPAAGAVIRLRGRQIPSAHLRRNKRLNLLAPQALIPDRAVPSRIPVILSAFLSDLLRRLGDSERPRAIHRGVLRDFGSLPCHTANWQGVWLWRSETGRQGVSRHRRENGREGIYLAAQDK